MEGDSKEQRTPVMTLHTHTRLLLLIALPLHQAMPSSSSSSSLRLCPPRPLLFSGQRRGEGFGFDRLTGALQ